jgi:hypothetical protein
MRNRVQQPPIQPAARDKEHHDFWPGFICGLVGLIVLFVGAFHITGVETTDGNSASEPQLIKAFSSGGIQYADLTVRPPIRGGPDSPPGMFVPPPPEPADESFAPGPRWRVKVNLGANTPCPT